ncbi:PAS domain-containing protein [Caballeronia sp. GAWG2-1]|uniref:hybrid sensor histidine kinase/response regulator n=1 Tax=Caballeronia sp. GAWG2-1 TaxID=2921744 RepID=UPI002028276D|nr:PAS domain-containing protein [Caballeronia sp. GAWG2-1]
MTDESSSHQDVAALQAEIESLRAQLNSRDDAHEQVLWQLSRDLLAVADEQGSLANVNPAWTRNLGWSLDEIIGQNLGEFVHEEDREETLHALQKLDRDGSTAEFKSRMRTASGSYRLLDGRVDRMRGRIFIVARDITELRDREIALNDSRDFARLALSAVSGVGAWTYEVASDCFFCDAAVSELYGIDAKEAARGIRREGFLANVHPDDRAALQSTMSGGLVRSGDLELEYRIRHPDGSTRWVLSRGNTHFNDAGVPVRRTGVGIDMTSQRDLEQQLRQSQKMEAVGHLTGGIAHDFNNMLQGVIGPLELIRHLVTKGNTAGLDRFIEMAISSAKRAAGLTHRLLAFSRRQPLAPKSVDIRELVVSLEDLIQQMAKETIALSVVADAEPCFVLCDTNQLESALLNLAINACDAMPDGGSLSIETSRKTISEKEARMHKDARPGQYVCIAVKDTGSGMPQYVVNQAFEPFFTTKPLGQGTGLGLSMVYGFVGQSGGFVTIDSSVGVGTVVRLFLPEEMEQADAAPDASVHRKEIGTGAGETILIVDDDETVRQVLQELFERLGYKTMTAHDGPSGLAVLQSKTPVDLLITDVGLPGLNGRQMADAARMHHPALPVLFITGYAQAATANNSLDTGMQMLTKPFSTEALLDRVRAMLGA